jgi:hypothetical protein
MSSETNQIRGKENFGIKMRPPAKSINLKFKGNEPMHIHVRKAGGFAKYWIEPIELEFSQGMKVNDLKVAEKLIKNHVELIKRKWYEVHGS